MEFTDTLADRVTQIENSQKAAEAKLVEQILALKAPLSRLTQIEKCAAEQARDIEELKRRVDMICRRTSDKAPQNHDREDGKSSVPTTESIYLEAVKDKQLAKSIVAEALGGLNRELDAVQDISAHIRKRGIGGQRGRRCPTVGSTVTILDTVHTRRNMPGGIGKQFTISVETHDAALPYSAPYQVSGHTAWLFEEDVVVIEAGDKARELDDAWRDTKPSAWREATPRTLRQISRSDYPHSPQILPEAPEDDLWGWIAKEHYRHEKGMADLAKQVQADLAKKVDELRCQFVSRQMFFQHLQDMKAGMESLQEPNAMGNEFTFTLDKSPEVDLGLSLDYEDGIKLRILEVLDSFNAGSATNCVKAGAHIVAVNGQRGDAGILLDELRRGGRLTITIAGGK